ncbi:hypothetical protein [Stutzerimonas balearica]|nr:hypothetical protein EGI99_05285 [Stutzerimonas stutzeri]
MSATRGASMMRCAAVNIWPKTSRSVRRYRL